MTRQARLFRALVDKQREATKALATGSLALFNQNDGFADAFEMARRLGPKVRRSGAQGRVKTCIYCYFGCTANQNAVAISRSSTTPSCGRRLAAEPGRDYLGKFRPDSIAVFRPEAPGVLSLLH
ncbi:hypothetical protein CGCS363_v014589 [Colletotrichum siamense]|uniref:uncharacterized protein n=1 Tax=Colletotrichum siamense TaxID=690259 RepID=UPI001872FECE|nr:uncharacterized protein CGCS363_v014589 [Colletotrichum siamense]KAF5485424.1 hypothetical protein CGCS363_v014589 [Colletotrichum siamense]